MRGLTRLGVIAATLACLLAAGGCQAGSRRWLRPRLLTATDSESRFVPWKVLRHPAADAFLWPGAVKLSPDGQRVAVEGFRVRPSGRSPRGRSTLFVWDVASGRLVFEREEQLVFFAFSPDSRRLLTIPAASRLSGAGPAVRAWDARTGQLKWTIRLRSEAPIQQACLSPDGAYLAGTCEWPAWGIHLWRLATGERIRSFRDVGHLYGFSSDGSLLSYFRQTWGIDCGGYVVRVSNRAQVDPPPGRPPTGAGWTFSPDGRLVAREVMGGAVEVADARTFQPLQRLHHPQWAVDTPEFSPDARLLLTAARQTGDRWSVALWDVQRRRLVQELPARHRSSTAFSADGDLLAVLASHEVMLWQRRHPATGRGDEPASGVDGPEGIERGPGNRGAEDTRMRRRMATAMGLGCLGLLVLPLSWVPPIPAPCTCSVWSAITMSALRDARLAGEDLQATMPAHSLVNCTLVGNWRHSDMRWACFSHCDLRLADLRGADLRHATYYRCTKWPAGFDPHVHGARLVE